MKRLVAVLVVGLVAASVSPAFAQPYYARGDFNGWDTSAPLTGDGFGTFSATITGLTPGDRPEYKIATGDWSDSWPGSNGKVVVDGAGEITFNFMPGPAADSWFPAADRVGYEDPLQFGWEIIGAFDGWTGTAMTDNGDGYYSIDYTIAAAGSYDFKFREAGSWDISIGDDFGNSAANNNVTTTTANEIWKFELDLPNGRWQTSLVPEPTTIALLGLGGLALIRRRR